MQLSSLKPRFQKPQFRKWRVRHPKLWAGLITAVVLAFVVPAVYKAIFVQPVNPQPKPPPAPSLAPQPLTPSNYQQTRRAFGPWRLATPGSTGAPHLVMLLSDGGVDVSSKVVHTSHGWSRASANEIIAVEAGHTGVRISTGDNNIYNLQYGQAFVLEERPDVVYGYLGDGPNRAVLVSTTVKTLIGR